MQSSQVFFAVPRQEWESVFPFPPPLPASAAFPQSVCFPPISPFILPLRLPPAVPAPLRGHARQSWADPPAAVCAAVGHAASCPSAADPSATAQEGKKHRHN
ncbi:unnamed protein product [Prorocentrum cordatum]|uniref:Uncharacterized protein n=1 Tax=Prorocentrum cordatum TaxID=2364126 RepID=A0ABN9V547_9DINO|nr:unnamed protein product [Polarella glacialis]